MLIRTFTLSFDPHFPGFDDRDLRQFLIGKRVLEIRDQFFTCHEMPYWSVMVLYEPASDGDELPNAKQENADRFKYRNQLSEKQKSIFDALRDWRNEKGKSEGVPPYIISTNEQLAEIVVREPKNLEELKAVVGFGESRVRKYGPEILERIPKESPHVPPAKEVEN
jgi:superfamily II DNA helicase RecQ